MMGTTLIIPTHSFHCWCDRSVNNLVPGTGTIWFLVLEQCGAWSWNNLENRGVQGPTEVLLHCLLTYGFSVLIQSRVHNAYISSVT